MKYCPYCASVDVDDDSFVVNSLDALVYNCNRCHAKVTVPTDWVDKITGHTHNISRIANTAFVLAVSFLVISPFTASCEPLWIRFSSLGSEHLSGKYIPGGPLYFFCIATLFFFGGRYIARHSVWSEKHGIDQHQIDRFVSLFINEGLPWPSPVSIPPTERWTLFKLIEGAHVSQSATGDSLFRVLDENVNYQLYAKQQQLFDHRFGEIVAASCGEIRPSQINVVSAYVSAFGENREYTVFTARFAAQILRIHLPVATLEDMISTEITRQTEFIRCRELANAMEYNSTLPRTPFGISSVDRMSGTEFEDLLAHLFSKMGYQVMPTRTTGDQGGDLVLEKFGERTVVQAKRSSGTVGNSAIQEVVAAKKFYNCSKSMVKPL